MSKKEVTSFFLLLFFYNPFLFHIVGFSISKNRHMTRKVHLVALETISEAEEYEGGIDCRYN